MGGVPFPSSHICPIHEFVRFLPSVRSIHHTRLSRTLYSITQSATYVITQHTLLPCTSDALTQFLHVRHITRHSFSTYAIGPSHTLYGYARYNTHQTYTFRLIRPFHFLLSIRRRHIKVNSSHNLFK